jgi:hypothetical protein
MPSVWRHGRPNASRSIKPVSTAISEYFCGRPRLLQRGDVQAAIAAGVTQTVKSPRRRRAVSYSRQFRTR